MAEVVVEVGGWRGVLPLDEMLELSGAPVTSTQTSRLTLCSTARGRLKDVTVLCGCLGGRKSIILEVSSGWVSWFQGQAGVLLYVSLVGTISLFTPFSLLFSPSLKEDSLSDLVESEGLSSPGHCDLVNVVVFDWRYILQWNRSWKKIFLHSAEPLLPS